MFEWLFIVMNGLGVRINYRGETSMDSQKVKKMARNVIGSLCMSAALSGMTLLTGFISVDNASAEEEFGCSDPICEDLDRSVSDAFQMISDLRGWSMKGFLSTTSGMRRDGSRFFQANIFVTDKNLPAKVVVERDGAPIAECQLVYGRAKRDFKGTYYSAQVVMNERYEDSNIGTCDLDLSAPGVQSGVITAEPKDLAIVYFQTGGRYLPFYVSEYYNYKYILQNQSQKWFEPNPLANKPSSNLRGAVRRLQREADAGLRAAKAVSSRSSRRTRTRR